MGNEASVVEETPPAVVFNEHELKRLGKRFKKLDVDNSGSLTMDEIMNLPELKRNPFVGRVMDILDKDQNDEVDFKEFIEGISQFSVKGGKTAKLKFVFRYVPYLVHSDLKKMRLNHRTVLQDIFFQVRN